VLKQQALNAIIDAVQHEPDMAQPAAVPPTGNKIDSILSQVAF